MDKKVLAILLITLVAACLVMGCTGRRDEGAAPPAPTNAPAAAPSLTSGATAQASIAPGQATATPVTASASATVGPSAAATASSGSGVAGLDPSLLSISGEGQDEGGYPDDGLPTPTLD